MYGSSFRHEVLFYDSPERFLAGTVPFVEAALEGGEPVLVALGKANIELLRGELKAAADPVRFADMEALGRNPARLIPFWREFVDECASNGTPARAIGEPIWPGRGAAEIDECQRHESLLNVAFGGEPAWSLLCSYDIGVVEDEVLEAAAHSHPYLSENGESRENAQCRELGGSPDQFAGGFEPAPAGARELSFDRDGIRALRDLVAAEAATAGLSSDRAADFVLAASEIATNSVRHGGGRGSTRLWRERGSLVVEVSDGGRIAEPLAGRVRPAPTQARGRGLWVANQVCDLVQIRSGEAGTAVRLHVGVG